MRKQTRSEGLLRLANELDCGEFPEELEPQAIAYTLRRFVECIELLKELRTVGGNEHRVDEFLKAYT